MDDIKAKQQVVEKIKSAGNILVTVSNDPPLDALSAALGLALIIDKLDKHATTIFSGQAPQAMKFLEPEKTFENTTDSLRDFIIALDKEKADHLRLKVEGEVAKIYITPYRTTIKPEDLQFSQGDNYNIELVVALGVDNQEHLDDALDAHGQILHDAPVVTITAGDQLSQLGGVDWHDSKSSSLSEMIATLGEALKDQEPLIDKQSATALLTGIVAATDRFSNPKTTSASMTVAAQLMGYGADQQLIANELQKSHEIGASVDMSSHGSETLADLDARVRTEGAEDSTEVEANIMNNTTSSAYGLPDTGTSNAYGIVEENPAAAPDSQVPSEETQAPEEPTVAPEPVAAPEPQPEVTPEPIVASVPSSGSAYALPDEPSGDSVPTETSSEPVVPQPAPEPAPAPVATATPADLGLPMPPPLPNFAPPATSAYAPEPSGQDASNGDSQPPQRLGDILNPDPEETSDAPTNAIPILSHGAPIPPAESPAPAADVATQAGDPSQFKIPGQ